MATPATILKEVKAYSADEMETCTSALIEKEKEDSDVVRGRAQAFREIIAIIEEGDMSVKDELD